MFLSEWHEFASTPCLTGKKNLMTVRVSMSLKSRASLTCFPASFLPGRAKDLSTPLHMCMYVCIYIYIYIYNKYRTARFEPVHFHNIPFRKI